jgi:hypothetical protein
MAYDGLARVPSALYVNPGGATVIGFQHGCDMVGNPQYEIRVHKNNCGDARYLRRLEPGQPDVRGESDGGLRGGGGGTHDLSLDIGAAILAVACHIRLAEKGALYPLPTALYPPRSVLVFPARCLPVKPLYRIPVYCNAT